MSEAAAAVVPQKSGPGLLVIILAALLAAGAAGAGVYFMTAKKDASAADAEHGDAKDAKDSKKPKLPAVYLKLDPPFVANFEARGAMRFLQVSVEIMTRDPEAAELVRLHDPMIRNDLLMLFGGQTYDVISTQDGKEQLRSKALDVVRHVITVQGGDGKKIEQVYFTSFVMQ